MKRVVAFLLQVWLLANPVAAQELIQDFSIRESFGVAHPDQIIDFDEIGRASCRERV